MNRKARTRGASRLAGRAPLVSWVRCLPLVGALLVGMACARAPVAATPSPGHPPSSPAAPAAALVPEATSTPFQPLAVTESPTAVMMPETTEPAVTPAAGLPDHLLIPKLKVNEAIVEVPIVDGAWDISGLGSQVGWLPTTGPQPGADWAMAFVGHVSLENGTSGPFGYLWQLRVGAEIILERDQTQFVYALTEKRDVSADAVRDLYVADGQQIVLLTCDNWDFVNWRYTERLLVMAQLVEERAAPN